MALLLAGALAGCEAEPPPAAPAEAPEAEDTPRPPRGGGARRCEGGSDDPSQIALFVESADRDLAGAIAGLEALVGEHPGSATARVRLGELLLRDGAPQRARPFFERALALHDEGCTLGPRDRWAAREGIAHAHAMAGDYAAAIPLLRGSLAEHPDATPTRYNLACALCRTGDLDGCERELTRALRTEDAVPDFLVDQRRPPGHYRRAMEIDPDLAPLRADRARLERVRATR